MKCLLTNLIFFVIVVDSDTSKRLFLPQLPIGEYRVNVLALLPCSYESLNDRIHFNYYLSKTSANTTEIKGNVTYLVPIDDSLNIEVNLAVKDSVGGWRDNAHIIKTPRACSSIKIFLGNSWTETMKSLGMHNIKYCPIPAGCYTTSGLKQDNYLRGNYPKQFFYGTYKFRFQFTKNKVVYGCSISVIEVKRPWEID